MARPPDPGDAFFAAVSGPAPDAAPLPVAPDDAAYLRAIGERLRTIRARRGMSRRLLAEQCGVSERYIIRMESGTGNASLLVMRAVARGLGVTPVDIMAERTDEDTPLHRLVARLTPDEALQAHALLARHFSARGDALRDRRIALIGLRGAGKSTLGRRLAAARGAAFHELDQLIARDAGTTIGAIFEQRGQGDFRRLERAALDRLLAGTDAAVIAAGGSIVATAATYERLLRACRTVWLRAAPEEHMQRVIDQGDLRPMAQSRTAMDDLRAILASREPLYARADHVLDTSGKTADESFDELLRLLA
jgi:XRE family aerobic/anaerobic benzoate catabolism transcriptional regulator